MKAFPNIQWILSRLLGMSVSEGVSSIRIEDVVSDILNKVPQGTEYDSEGGYLYPGYDGEEVYLLYSNGQQKKVKWEGQINSRNSYTQSGERVVDTIICHQDECGLPKAILFYTGHNCGQQSDEWTLTVYLWGNQGESLLREIAQGDEDRVLRALDYPWSKQREKPVEHSSRPRRRPSIPLHSDGLAVVEQ